MNIYHIIHNNLKNNVMIKNKCMTKYQTIQYLFLLITLLLGAKIHAGYNPDWIKVENQSDVINGTSLSIKTTLKTGNATGNVSVSISTPAITNLPPQTAALINNFSWDTTGRAIIENGNVKEYTITAKFQGATALSTCKVWARLQGLTLNHIYGNNNQVGKCVDLIPADFDVQIDPSTDAWKTYAKQGLSIPNNHGPVGEKIARVTMDPGQSAECRYTTSLAPMFVNYSSAGPQNPQNPPNSAIYNHLKYEYIPQGSTGFWGMVLYWCCNTYSDFQYVFDHKTLVLTNTGMLAGQNYGISTVVATTRTAGFEIAFPTIPQFGTLTISGSYAIETSTEKQWNENAPVDNRYLYDVQIWQKYYKLSGKAQLHSHKVLPGDVRPVQYSPGPFWSDETPVANTSAVDSSGYYDKQIKGIPVRVCHPN